MIAAARALGVPTTDLGARVIGTRNGVVVHDTELDGRSFTAATLPSQVHDVLLDLLPRRGHNARRAAAPLDRRRGQRVRLLLRGVSGGRACPSVSSYVRS
ncbi:MAG TPA: hypothetical protein VFK02_34795 [Kofleriaceae bacterium]|nr:hypothetical protein [Kofleriaceae bacterium]